MQCYYIHLDMQMDKLKMNNLDFVNSVDLVLKSPEIKNQVIWLMASFGETENSGNFKENQNYYNGILNSLLDNMLYPLSDDNSHYADKYLPIIKTFFFGYFCKNNIKYSTNNTGGIMNCDKVMLFRNVTGENES